MCIYLYVPSTTTTFPLRDENVSGFILTRAIVEDAMIDIQPCYDLDSWGSVGVIGRKEMRC